MDVWGIDATGLLAPYTPKVKDSTKAELELAIHSFANGDLDQTRKRLSDVCATEPKVPSPGLLLAHMLNTDGKIVLARRELERVVNTLPDDPTAYLMLGELELEQGNIDAAESWIRKSTEAGRRSRIDRHRELAIVARIRVGYAAIGRQRQNWKSVVRLLKPVVEHDPCNTRAVGELARGLFRDGDAEASYSVLRWHWERKNKSIRRPELSMAVLYEQSGDLSRATHLMKLAVDRSPSHAATQTFVSNWALEHGDLETAQHCAERALIATNSSIDSRMLLARAARFRGEMHLAREMLESVHLQVPDRTSPAIELAIVLAQMEGLELRGLRYAKLATKTQPSLESKLGREAAIAKTWIEHKLKQPIDRSYALGVLAAGEVNPESLYFAAEFLMGFDRGAAKKLLEQALRSREPFPAHAEARELYVTTSW
jgi:Tfp pilus assembly protein PilF